MDIDCLKNQRKSVKHLHWRAVLVSVAKNFWLVNHHVRNESTKESNCTRDNEGHPDCHVTFLYSPRHEPTQGKRPKGYISIVFFSKLI